MMKRWIFSLVILLSAEVQARYYNYQEIPLAERSFGMGGVSMAMVSDVGNIFFNPSMLAYLETPMVGSAVSAYTRIDSRTGEYVNVFRSVKDNISRGGFLSIPSMVGGNIKSGPFVWGGAVLIPLSFKSSGDLSMSGDGVSGFENLTESSWLGAFVSRRWGKHSFGASFFYASQSFFEKFFFVNATDPLETRYIEHYLSNNGVVVVLGGAYDFNPKWRLGYSLRSPVWAFGGEGSFVDAQSGSSEFLIDNFKPRGYHLPARLSAGLSYRPSKRWSFGFDLHYYVSSKKELSSSNVDIFRIDAKNVLNFNLGAEWLAYDFLGFRIGAFSNFTSAKNLSSPYSTFRDKVNMGGLSGALYFPSKTGSISLGGYLQFGQGVMADFRQDTVVALPKTLYLYGVVIGSTYTFK